MFDAGGSCGDCTYKSCEAQKKKQNKGVLMCIPTLIVADVGIIAP